MMRSKFWLLFLLCYIFFLNRTAAQESYTVYTKLIEGNLSENITVNAAELDDYIKAKKLTDTTNKKADLLKVVASAKIFVKYGSEKTMDLALKRVEYYFAHKEDIDKILVIKHKRQMHLMRKGKIIKTFPIALGFNPVGQKVYEGDGKTPEGNYTLDAKNYYGDVIGSFHISYPNQEDKDRAAKKGLKAGSHIMVHGTEGPKKRKDFTNGCIALSNKDLETLRSLIFIGTPIEILK